MRFCGRFHVFFLAFATLDLSACGQMNFGNSVSSNGSVALRPEGSETSYSTSTDYTGQMVVQIVAKAQYQRFNDDSNGGAQTGTGLTAGNPYNQGLVSVETRPIRQAEVVIIDTSSNAVIQTGYVQNDGDIVICVPKVAGNYKLEVRSRANTSKLMASVMDNPYDKNLYRISQTFSITAGTSTRACDSVAIAEATASGSLAGITIGSTLVAPYSGTLEGGAFNILDDIFVANEYLRAHAKANAAAGTPDFCPAAICSANFTVAPKVQVYWTKGISPGTYYGSPSSAISYYVGKSGGGLYEGLYILGGIEGSLCTDTDHFDNSVILHEYGHFLEHAFALSDSPGGSHSGNKIIDPRLAWSEGWANFFQAAALGRSFYRDTQKNSECTPTYSSGTGRYTAARLSFTDFDMETQLGSQDQPTKIGEGNFREISVSRMLWDTITGATQVAPYGAAGNVDGTSADLGFAVLWESFKSLTSASLSGRNVGHVSQALYTRLSSPSFGASYVNAWTDETYADTSKPLVRELQRHDLRDFGMTLAPQAVAHGACTASSYGSPDWVFTNADPRKDTVDSSGAITYSDMFNTNDMYRYDYDGSSAKATIKLHYKKWSLDGSGIATPWDLDLYVYQDGFTFLDNTTIVRKSEDNYPETGLAGYSSAGGYTGYEVVDLSGLPAGTYFINIKAFYVGASATAKAGTQYYLENGTGAQLCP